MNRIKIIDLGFLDYKNSWNYQKELQKKVIQLTDELADANYTIKKLQQKGASKNA